ncbi:hypothetical protein [Clostridium sp.]|uniref:hypothetical protein n=1 Tax=Clostridium sp. TaxID=1506 RepID=UPI0032165BB1
MNLTNVNNGDVQMQLTTKELNVIENGLSFVCQHSANLSDKALSIYSEVLKDIEDERFYKETNSLKLNLNPSPTANIKVKYNERHNQDGYEYINFESYEDFGKWYIAYFNKVTLWKVEVE